MDLAGNIGSEEISHAPPPYRQHQKKKKEKKRK